MMELMAFLELKKKNIYIYNQMNLKQYGRQWEASMGDVFLQFKKTEWVE